MNFDYKSMGAGERLVNDIESLLKDLKTAANSVKYFPNGFIHSDYLNQILDKIEDIKYSDVTALEEKVENISYKICDPNFGFSPVDQAAYDSGYNEVNNIMIDIMKKNNNELDTLDMNLLANYLGKFITERDLEKSRKDYYSGDLTEEEYQQIGDRYQSAVQNYNTVLWDRALTYATYEMQDTDGKGYAQRVDERKNVYNLKTEMGIEMSQEEIDYYNKTSDELFWTDVGSYAYAGGAGAVTGVLEIVENIGDAIISIGGESTTDIVAYDWTKAIYDSGVEYFDLNTDIAYGYTYSISNVLGNAAGEIALQFVPGGAIVTGTLHGVKAYGKSYESAIKSGEDISRASLYALGNGVLEGFASTLLYGKVKDYTGERSLKVLDKLDDALRLSKKTLAVDSNMFKRAIVEFNSNHGKVLTKSIIAATKEGAKEVNKVWLADNSPSFDSFVKNAAFAVGTQFINELYVAPKINSKISKSDVDARKKIVDIAKDEKAMYNYRLEEINNKLEVQEMLKNTATTEFDDVVSEIGVEDAIGPLRTEKAYLESLVKTCDDAINKNKLNFIEKIISTDFIAKEGKKASSAFISEIKDVYSLIEEYENSN